MGSMWIGSDADFQHIAIKLSTKRYTLAPAADAANLSTRSHTLCRANRCRAHSRRSGGQCVEPQGPIWVGLLVTVGLFITGLAGTCLALERWINSLQPLKLNSVKFLTFIPVVERLLAAPPVPRYTLSCYQ
jgi:hypothetical protein